MSYFATAGSKVFIGGVINDKKEDFVAADFTSQSWIEIDGPENIGSVGDTAATITSSVINRGRDVTMKGTRNAGTMELILNINYADAGQIALLAAEKSVHNYAFKVEFNDAPEGGTPSQRMFIALVMSASEALDEANNIMKLNSSLAVNSNIVRINATEGP